MKKLLLCASIAVGAVWMPMSAHATYPGGKGNITFLDAESDRGDAGFTDLLRITPKGKVLGSLLRCESDQGEQPSSPCASSGAAFSRHGDRVAFAIDGRLAVAAANGTSRVLLPRLTDADSDPAWTRGSKLLFTGRKGGKRNVYIVNANGAGLRQLTQTGGRSAAYSVGGLVAYTAGGFVRLVKPDGSGARRLAHGAKPDFSPSGKTVVYELHRHLYSRSLRKGAKRRLIARKGTDPVFSPTGKRILYVGPGHENTDVLDTVSPRGKRRHKVYDPHTSTAVETEGLSGPAWQPRR